MARYLKAFGLSTFAALLAELCILPARGQSVDAVDPLAGDSRLETKLTVSAVGTSFPDFLSDLSTRTGVRFTADRTVAEDKITLFAQDRPLSATLKAVAHFFNFTWRREG